MAKPYPSIGYTDYLKLNELTRLQQKRSDTFQVSAHDEMLFIIVHQTYELWFKQILTELDSVLKIFASPQIDEAHMGTAVHRLERIVEIQKILVQQVTVLETMTPLDFLDFRDLLYPASGFQSVQNRLIENKLGLRGSDRHSFNSLPYHSYLDEASQKSIRDSESKPSLFDLIDSWLARTPFLQTEEFDFWQMYRGAVENLFNEDRQTIENHALLKPEEREKNLREIEVNRQVFQAFFDETSFAELRKQGAFRLSYPAMHAALLIQLYRDEPVLHLPYRLLTALQNIDELLTTWRYRHSLMAHRMLGRKIGTGGSAGADYLKTSTDKHRIFSDFFNLATFLIPRSRLPRLSQKMKERLGFAYPLIDS